jgi:hypothetical protein
MATEGFTFARWLADSAVPEAALTVAQRAVLQAALQFLDHRGHDYYSVRLLSHVLLHARTGLKIAQIARLLGLSRAAASAQQGLSSKEVVQAAHHRLAGRTHGKLLPRFAGPIAHFLHEQPHATRWDLLDFIQRTWGVSVSRMALHKFLKKYGLDQPSPIVARAVPAAPAPAGTADASPAAERPAATAPGPVLLAAAPVLGAEVPVPAQDFFLPRPSTPEPSCCCPRPSTGSGSRKAALKTPTARSDADC